MPEAEIGRMAVLDQSGQKCLQDLHFNGEKLGIVSGACYPSDGRRCKIGLQSRLTLAKRRPYLK
jgi:hypothetical protein